MLDQPAALHADLDYRQLEPFVCDDPRTHVKIGGIKFTGFVEPATKTCARYILGLGIFGNMSGCVPTGRRDKFVRIDAIDKYVPKLVHG